MNRWDLYRLLLILGLITLNGFLVWALSSIIMLIVSGVDKLSAGTLVLGCILMWMFGGLIMLGILIISVIILGLIFGG